MTRGGVHLKHGANGAYNNPRSCKMTITHYHHLNEREKACNNARELQDDNDTITAT
jgi:hypothetical protein